MTVNSIIFTLQLLLLSFRATLLHVNRFVIVISDKQRSVLGRRILWCRIIISLVCKNWHFTVWYIRSYFLESSFFAPVHSVRHATGRMDQETW